MARRCGLNSSNLERFHRHRRFYKWPGAVVLNSTNLEHFHHHRRFYWTTLALNTHLGRRRATCRDSVTSTCSLKTDNLPHHRNRHGAGRGTGLRFCLAPRCVGWILTGPLSLLFSAGVPFSFKPLVSRGCCLSIGGGALGRLI